MPDLTALRRHPHLLLGSALLVALGLLGSVLHAYQSHRAQVTQMDVLGEALADNTVARVAEPTLSQDLVSLQVILQDTVAQHEAVTGAAIDDVEGERLVQSGELNAERLRHYRTPIQVQEHIAGQLQLALKPPVQPRAEQALIVIWAALAVLLAAAPWGWLWYENRRAARAAAQASPAEPEPAPERAAVRLSLYLTNLDTLYNQLNTAGFRQMTHLFQEQSHRVIRLYGGQTRTLYDKILIVDFRGENYADCAFRALCAARLLIDLARATPGPRLKPAASIQALPSPEQPHSLAAQFSAQHSERRHPAPGEILLATQLVSAPLEEHVDLDPATGRVQTLRPPYRDMLAKQYRRLREHQ